MDLVVVVFITPPLLVAITHNKGRIQPRRLINAIFKEERNGFRRRSGKPFSLECDRHFRAQALGPVEVAIGVSLEIQQALPTYGCEFVHLIIIIRLSNMSSLEELALPHSLVEGGTYYDWAYQSVVVLLWTNGILSPLSIIAFIEVCAKSSGPT